MATEFRLPYIRSRNTEAIDGIAPLPKTRQFIPRKRDRNDAQEIQE
jgi:hypothetical protein